MYGPSVAKGYVEINDSTRALAEVNINGNINKILNLGFEEENLEESEYFFKICAKKKCLHQGVCTKNLCNHPENLANFAEQGISGMLSKILLLFLGSHDLSQASSLQAEQFTK